MTRIRRLGLIIVAFLLTLTACGQEQPTAVLVTPPSLATTATPTPNPSLLSASLVITELDAVRQNAQPRLRIGSDGTLHFAWLDRQAARTMLRYRQWTKAESWSEAEVLQTWEGTAPIQWDMVLDGTDIPYVMWSEPGRLTLLRRSAPDTLRAQEAPLPVGGDASTRGYMTNFGFTISGSAVYVVYRDTTRDAPFFRLGYSSNSGKEWEKGEPILTDPAAPTLVHPIGLAAGPGGVLHLIMSAGADQLYLYSNPDDRKHWRGLMSGQDLFEQGRLGRDVKLDSHGFPHVLLESNGQSYYAFWDGRTWIWLQTPLLGAARGTASMGFGLGPDDLTWIIGTAPPQELPGLWLRTFRGRDASDPYLLKTGDLTECDIAVGPERAHIVAVIDGWLWHLTDQAFGVSNLPRHQIE